MKKLTIFIFIFIFLISSIFVGCAPDLISNENVKTINSSDNKYFAVLFKRDGGATTPNSLQVSLYKKGAKINNDKGNVFISNRIDLVDIEWNDKGALVVKYNGSDDDVLKKITSKYNAKIEYISDSTLK